ncbi:MAG TPA: DUF58 domain-containing protein [Kofleriaceae bacterium]|nr:DUF58 domain-containing protein [Kofleriaceae bacterium]
MPPLTRPETRRARIASLLGAPWLAVLAGTLAARDELFVIAVPALAVLWVAMASALAVRALRRVPDEPARFAWEQVDVLTATGGAVLWTATAAIALAAITAWASLALIGTIGVAAVLVAATWTAVVAGGDRPWRRAIVRRTISPEVAIEGDPLREEIRMSGVRIPAGMRLFVTGWTTWHGVVTRYAIDASAAHAEVKLAAELGAATRGEHRAPLLRLWLADTLGLTRTAVAHRGGADFVVLPRPGMVDNARGLLATGGHDDRTQPASRLPTEGTFRIRDYVPGDDTRRIHWVRSLQADKLIMRLPDEIPPAEPALRLVIDNELNPAYAYLCAAPVQLLDALVQIWLGIGNALAASGTRVTLVAAAGASPHAEKMAMIERVVHPGTPREALRLGARIAWQDQVTLGSLLAHSPTRQLVVSSRPRPLVAGGRVLDEPLWIVVPEASWTTPETWLSTALPVVLAFPIGAAENRLGRRHRERERRALAQRDREMFSGALRYTGWQRAPGHYLARPVSGRVDLAVMR